MHEIIQPFREKMESEVRHWMEVTPRQRDEGYDEAAKRSFTSMLDMALIIQAKERLGEDTSLHRRNPWYPILRAIGEFRLIPDLIERVRGSIRVAQRISYLPLPDQQKLLADGGVEIVEEDDFGAFSERFTPLENITPTQAMQIFSADHIRNPGEQRIAIKRKKAKQRQVANQEPFVFRGKGVIINGYFVSYRRLRELASGTDA